jgi:hypothetical protein
MKYRGWTIYAEGAINNWCDFELDSNGYLEITDFISDGGEADALNITGFVILSSDESYHDYGKTLNDARERIDAWVLRDAAAAAVAALNDPECNTRQRLLDVMNALESALQPSFR